jgi:hypoxanthine phosphoribosyltransferase
MTSSSAELEREYLSWRDFDMLMDHLLLQFEGKFDGLLMIARGGLVPGGYLAEVMKIDHVLVATVHFDPSVRRRWAWPRFAQFPDDSLLTQRRILIVDDIWATGRDLLAVHSRVKAADAQAEMAVLHYRPSANIFAKTGPHYYGAITDRYIVYPWETPPIFPPEVSRAPIVPT